MVLQQRQLERMQQWQAECEAVRQRKEAAQLAKSRAEVDFSNARTQQEAERAEKATKEAVLALKVRGTSKQRSVSRPGLGVVAVRQAAVCVHCVTQHKNHFTHS